MNEKTVPWVMETNSPCTADLVTLEGSLHIVVREGTSGDRNHFGADVHFTGAKGFGFPSGSRYVEMDVQNTQANITPGRQNEFTAERTMNLTRLGEVEGVSETFGDGDDLRLHAIAHMTMNANGVVTVDKIDERLECR